jgi:hypothetical protein
MGQDYVSPDIVPHKQTPRFTARLFVCTFSAPFRYDQHTQTHTHTHTDTHTHTHTHTHWKRAPRCNYIDWISIYPAIRFGQIIPVRPAVLICRMRMVRDSFSTFCPNEEQQWYGQPVCLLFWRPCGLWTLAPFRVCVVPWVHHGGRDGEGGGGEIHGSYHSRIRGVCRLALHDRPSSLQADRCIAVPHSHAIPCNSMQFHASCSIDLIIRGSMDNSLSRP